MAKSYFAQNFGISKFPILSKPKYLSCGIACFTERLLGKGPRNPNLSGRLAAREKDGQIVRKPV